MLLVPGWLAASVLTASAALPVPDISGVPLYAPQNPVETNRSALFAPPLLMPAETWAVSFAFDYASAIESYSTVRRSILLDAELARFQATVARRLDDRWFAFGQVGIQGAYDGFMDRFLNWYHSLVGVRYYARELRPINRYAYSIQYERDRRIAYGPVDLAFTDSKLGVGVRLGSHGQLLLVAGIPTSTAPGFGAGTVQGALMLTGELPMLSWLVFDGTLGVGATPRTGTLAAYQNVLFASGSLGMRVRLSWRNSLYGTLFVHTAPLHGTDLHPTDQADFSADVGWLFRIDRGTELWLALTEDPYPDGPALDVTFRLGLRFGF